MKSGVLAACLAVAAAFATTGALAYDENLNVPTDADRDKITSCLDDAIENGTTGDACVGLVSGPCLADPENFSNVAMGGCLDRERTIWNGVLNADYKELMKGLDRKRAGELKATQKNWIALREATCAMEVSFFEGGSGMGNASLGCALRETAHRALTLHAFTDYLGQ